MRQLSFLQEENHRETKQASPCPLGKVLRKQGTVVKRLTWFCGSRILWLTGKRDWYSSSLHSGNISWASTICQTVCLVLEMWQFQQSSCPCDSLRKTWTLSQWLCTYLSTGRTSLAGSCKSEKRKKKKRKEKWGWERKWLSQGEPGGCISTSYACEHILWSKTWPKLKSLLCSLIAAECQAWYSTPEGVQNMPPQNVPLWHTDYFELEALEN